MLFSCRQQIGTNVLKQYSLLTHFRSTSEITQWICDTKRISFWLINHLLPCKTYVVSIVTQASVS